MLVLAGAVPASAHVRDTAGYSTIHAEGKEVSYSLSLEYEILAKAVKLESAKPGVDGEPGRQSALDAAHADLEKYLFDRVAIYLDGVACQPRLDDASTAMRDSTPYAKLNLIYLCSGTSGRYQLQYDVFSGAEAIADDHTNIVDYQLGGREGRTVMDSSHTNFSVGDNSLFASSSRFVVMGMEHLLFGLDHVLFVIALILGATSLRNLVVVLSMFTLAHSVTLIAALVGWVNVSPDIVEPLIAVSIVFVAIENLLGATRRRLPVVFAFGLLHGLGFAGSLQVTDEVSWNLVTSLLSFNIGIEVSQLMVLLAAFPLLLLVRRSRWSVPILRGATIVVAGFGLIWFIERFFLT